MLLSQDSYPDWLARGFQPILALALHECLGSPVEVLADAPRGVDGALASLVSCYGSATRAVLAAVALSCSDFAVWAASSVAAARPAGHYLLVGRRAEWGDFDSTAFGSA